MKLKFRNRTRIIWLFVLVCTVTIIAAHYLGIVDTPSVLALVTTIGGGFAFWHSKQTQELQLFRELFREFNARYDTLNERLNEILNRPAEQALSDSDIFVLYDYFNLCAEEYMYYMAGCVDERVWKSWKNGMLYVLGDARIASLWEKELRADSYYGLSAKAIGLER